MEDDNPYSGLNFTSQTYNVLDDAMVKMYENNEYKESARLAAQLLTVSISHLLNIHLQSHTSAAAIESLYHRRL